MNSLEVTALVLAVVWLGALTMVVLLLVRQLGLISVRLATEGTGPDQSIPIGMPIPEAVVEQFPDLADGLGYLVFLSSNCSACTEFAGDLDQLSTGARIRVLVAGVDDYAETLADLIPAGFETIREPLASTVASALQIRGTPIALQVEKGILTGRAVGNRVDDIRRLLDAYFTSDSRELATSLREVIDSARV